MKRGLLLILCVVLFASAAEPNLFYKVNRFAWEAGYSAGMIAGAQAVHDTSLRIKSWDELSISNRMELDWEAFITTTSAKMGTNAFRGGK